MYHSASGYQQYYPPASHDEQQGYSRGSIYMDPSDPRHPRNLQPGSYYYLPQPPHQSPTGYPQHIPAQPVASPMSYDRAPMPAVPPPMPPQDPAFSSDPRANPANPYAHYTAYRMDSREEILPLGPSHNSFYGAPQPHDMSYHARDPRVIPSSSHRPQRDISSIYGPPLAHPSNSRPVSDASHYSRFSYAAPPVQDPRASAASNIGSVRLPYDAPETYAPVVPMPPPVTQSSSHASSMSKLQKKQHSSDNHSYHNNSAASLYAGSAVASSYSSSSSSFVHVSATPGKSSTSLVSSAKSKSSLYVANPNSDSAQYAIFTPAPGSPHSLDSSRSSPSSREEPLTPPQASSDRVSAGSYKSSKLSKHSHSSKKSLQIDTDKVRDIINVSATEDFPPAYTPLPSETEVVTVSSPPASDAKPDVSITLSPEGITVSSSSAPAPMPSGSRERGSSGDSNDTANIAMPQPHTPAQQSPPQDGTAPVGFPSMPSSSSVQAPSEIKKSRSRKPSIATPPKDLDKIDELDETDPLGFAWHHGGPYEAISKAAKDAAQQNGSAPNETGGPKIFAAQAGNDTNVRTNESTKVVSPFLRAKGPSTNHTFSPTASLLRWIRASHHSK
ncbi:hypothetical protein BDW22DRAFT_24076 [Trametopsis cervina]|nr:hypothetical protein BDW22DRAFT_24076 [Trametopsis cervina]